MRKKLIYSLIGLAGLFIGIYLYLSKSPPILSAEEYCAFCDPKVLDRQKFYEDDLVLALYTHKPMFPGHCLIIPKRHAERFEMLTDEEITQMGRVIKKVDQAAMQVFKTRSYVLIQKNGPEAGQSVPHVHFHYISREAGDNSGLKFILKMYIANFLKPISAAEMQKVVGELKGAMEYPDAIPIR